MPSGALSVHDVFSFRFDSFVFEYEAEMKENAAHEGTRSMPGALALPCAEMNHLMTALRHSHVVVPSRFL